jgi:signal transduction histidine kinase
MVDPGSQAATANPLAQQVWAQLNNTIQAATGWRTLLADCAGAVVEDGAGAEPGAADSLPLSPALVRAVHSTCRSGDARVVLDESADGLPLRWAVVPIVIAGQALGVLLAGGLPATEHAQSGPRIGAADADQACRLIGGLVTAIAGLYGAGPHQTVAVQDRYLAAQRRATALYDLSTLITSTLELGPIVELLLTQTRQLFGADRAAVFLQGDGGELRCVNAVGLSGEYLNAVNQMYKQAAGGRVEQTGQTLVVEDATVSPAMGPLRAMAAREGFRSMVVTPFVYHGRPIGALTLYHDSPHEYSADDVSALTTFANHVAVALGNARLFEQAQRQVRRSNFLADAGRLLNSSLDMGHVLNSLSRSAVEVLGEACAIYLLRKNEDELALTAYADQLDENIRDRVAFLEAHPPRLGASGIGLAAIRGESLLVDVRHLPLDAVHDLYLEGLGAHSYLVVPLLAQQRLVGALVLWLVNPALTFAPEDIALCEALADHAAIALENARLYERELRTQQAKDEFLSSVSHELRTPLTAILGYTQLIRKSAPDEQGKLAQQLNVIWSQAQRLNRLVETILDISNIEQGQLNLHLERLDLWTVVNNALDRLRATTRPGLVFDVRASTPHCWVMGDRTRLEQVFGHLIANAIKYSPANGTVVIAMENQASRAVVRIVDAGTGMTTGQLAQLFQRYYQGDTPLNRSGGLGLGLYISRAIIEEHGGAISAESTPGTGSVFQVTLPAEPEEC